MRSEPAAINGPTHPGAPARTTEFDAEDSSDPTNIDNPWLPLTHGRKFVLQGVADGLPHRVVFITTDLTKVINGVRRVVLWGRDYADEELQLAELAFFAPDDAGNVR